MLLARLRAGLQGASLSDENSQQLFTARQSFEIATRGGAAVLGRDDIGSLETGKCADFFAINLNHLDYAGALHDPVAAILFCQPRIVDWNFVNGKAIVKNGNLVSLELGKLIENHNRAAKRLLTS